jgi:hypothetical protein
MQNLEQLQRDVPILKTTIDLYEEFYAYLKIFPKKDQYMLGKHCEKHIIVFLELILSAVGLPKEHKYKYLVRASNKLDVLTVFIRIAWKLKMLNEKGYLSLQLKIEEIGRMLGGWIRSLQ